MGADIRVKFPPFAAHPFRSVTDIPAAWIQRELDFRTVPRFLISIFVADQKELLRTVLRTVDDGLILPEPKHLSKVERTVRFSIDGSLSSSLEGAFTLALVAQTCVSTPLQRTLPNYLDFVPNLLTQKLETQLKSLNERAKHPLKINVHRFEELEDRLFAGRRFTEYRFGVTRGSERARQRLAEMTMSFTAELGRHKTPIAYLYFPDDGDDDESSTLWVKLGVGAPERAVESMDLDLLANAIADKNMCIYSKYNPNRRRGRSMPERFSVIADYERPWLSKDSSPAHSAEADVVSGIDVVFTQGPARAGFVGQMLAGGSGPQLLGGSMTVLAGHTLACWIVPPGKGAALAREIQAAGSIDNEGSSSVFELESLNSTGANYSREIGYWLGWQCRDRPGVLRQLVDEIVSFIGGIPGSPPDFTYSISRVLAAQELCAGKLKFRVPAAVCSEVDRRLPELQNILCNVLSGDDEEESENQMRAVVLQRAEPGEEPWASLVAY